MLTRQRTLVMAQSDAAPEEEAAADSRVVRRPLPSVVAAKMHGPADVHAETAVQVHPDGRGGPFGRFERRLETRNPLEHIEEADHLEIGVAGSPLCHEESDLDAEL